MDKVLNLSKVLKGKHLGEGKHGTVYEHPKNPSEYVVKVPKKLPAVVPNSMPMTPVVDAFPGHNFGQAVAQYQPALPEPVTFLSKKSKPVEVLKRVNGTTGFDMYKTTMPEARVVSPTNLDKVTQLEGMPQEAYDEFRRRLKTVMGFGYDVDPHPGNMIQGNNELTPIDTHKKQGVNWDTYPQKNKMVHEYVTGLDPEYDLQSTLEANPHIDAPARNTLVSSLESIRAKLQQAAKNVPVVMGGADAMSMYGAVKEGKEQGISPMGKFLSNMIPWNTIAPTGRGTVKNLKTGEEYKEMY